MLLRAMHSERTQLPICEGRFFLPFEQLRFSSLERDFMPEVVEFAWKGSKELKSKKKTRVDPEGTWHLKKCALPVEGAGLLDPFFDKIFIFPSTFV